LQVEVKLSCDSAVDWKARQGGAVTEPSDAKLQSLLSSQQIHAFCKQATSVVGLSFGALVLRP
jgi:hypothetical protein